MLSAHLARNYCALPLMDMTPSKSTARRKFLISSHSMREASPLRNALRTVSIIDWRYLHQFYVESPARAASALHIRYNLSDVVDRRLTGDDRMKLATF